MPLSEEFRAHAQEIHNQIVGISQTLSRSSMALACLLVIADNEEIYRAIPRHDDPTKYYDSLGAYIKHPTLNLSNAAMSDLIFIAGTLKPYVETELNFTNDKLIEISFNKLRVAIPILRVAIRNHNTARVAEWLESARSMTVRQLYKEKDAYYGRPVLDPIEACWNAMAGGFWKFTAQVNNTQLEHIRNRVKLHKRDTPFAWES